MRHAPHPCQAAAAAPAPAAPASGDGTISNGHAYSPADGLARGVDAISLGPPLSSPGGNSNGQRNANSSPRSTHTRARAHSSSAAHSPCRTLRCVDSLLAVRTYCSACGSHASQPHAELVISSPSQLIMNSLLSQRCVAAGPSPTYRFPSSPRVGSCRLDHRQHGGRRKPISWVLQSWLERHAHRGAPACSASGVCGVGAKVKKEVR
jgi:hypothetical protein